MNKKFLSQLSLYALVPLAIYLCSKIKLFLMLGPGNISLTGLSLLFPALGSIIALPSSALLIGLYFLFKTLLGSYSFTFGLPTLLATANWSASYYHKKNSFVSTNIIKFLLQVITPLICISLFFIHPEGHKAIAFSFYWFIPITLFLFQKFNGTSVFATALSSTFIAHAVGSVIGIYVFNIPASIWISLLPIVAIERLIFASGTTFAYYVIRALVHTATTTQQIHINKQPTTYLN